MTPAVSYCTPKTPVRIAFTDDEYALIQDNAARQGLTVEAYILACVVEATL